MNLQATADAYRTDATFAATANERMTQLLTRSATDATFRTKLLTEPRAAIAEFNGLDVAELPPSFNVVFVENTASATVVLPDFIDASAELNESELEAVAGGITPTTSLVLVAVTMGSAAILAAYNSGVSDGRGHCN